MKEVAAKLTAERTGKNFVSTLQPVIEVTHKGKKRHYLVVDPDIAFRLGLNEETDRTEQSIGQNGELVIKLKRQGAGE